MSLANRNHRKTLVLAALALLIALFAAGCGDSEKSSTTGSSDKGEAFRIGLQAPLSGDLAILGAGMLEGAQLAAKELNEDGGLLGKDIEIVPIDDKGDPETGVTSAKAAISSGLDGVVGPYNSGVGIKTLPLFIDDGLVPIRLTSDDATNGLGFTLQPMTYQIAPVAAKAMSDWQKAKTVAIIFDETEAYTKAEADKVLRALNKDDVDVVEYEGIKPGKSDYTSVVQKAAKSGADVVYLVTYYPEGGLIAKEMYDAKAKPQCLADYGAYDTGFIETAGEQAAAACPVVGVPAPADFAGSEEHVAAYKEEYKKDPGTWSPYTFDSVNFLAAGVKQAGTFDTQKLEAALDAVKDWKGWTGSVTINPKNGTREPGTVVVTKTDGKGGFTVDLDWAKAVGAPYGD